MYKVRFHLGAGKHYKMWQVTELPDKVTYYSPDEVQLHLTNCKLKNQRVSAEKIHAGANKSVCAWILCQNVEVTHRHTCGSKKVHFNPRENPFWTDVQGNNVDGHYYAHLITSKREVYVEN